MKNRMKDNKIFDERFSNLKRNDGVVYFHSTQSPRPRNKNTNVTPIEARSYDKKGSIIYIDKSGARVGSVSIRWKRQKNSGI